jgi:hypothetical protein
MHYVTVQGHVTHYLTVHRYVTRYVKMRFVWREKCALLGYYAACSDNSLPMYREHLSVSSSRVKVWRLHERPITLIMEAKGQICLNCWTAWIIYGWISNLTSGRSVDSSTVLRAERSRVLIPVGATDFLASRKTHTGSMTHPTSFLKGTGVLSQGWSRRVVMLTTQLHLAPRLKMKGTSLHSTYVPLWYVREQLYHS